MGHSSEYVDLKSEWLLPLPHNWGIKRLKYLVDGKLEYGANEVAELDDTNLPRYIRITDFDDSGKLRQDTFKSLPFDQAKEYLLTEGDILFARSGATVGKTFQFKNYEGHACFAGYLIKARPRKKVLLSDFLYFFTKSGIYENWKNAIFNQATIQNIGADKYQNVFLSLPSLKDQELICEYLNQQTVRIDDFIAKKERMIEFLEEERAAIINQAVTKGLDPNVEMKDSGVNWIGRIPVSWEIKKLKYVLRNFDGKRVPLSAEERSGMQGEYPYYGSNGIVGWVNDYLFDGEYILLGEDGAPFFELYKDVAFLVRGRFWVNNHAHILKADHRYSHRFLTYALNRVDYRRHITGSTRDKLTQDDMSVIESPIPNLAEQETISDYLDKKTTQIDGQISLEERSIELLKEYRTVLISEAVTGKIDVRGS